MVPTPGATKVLAKRGGQWAEWAKKVPSRHGELTLRGVTWPDRLARWEAELVWLQEAQSREVLRKIGVEVKPTEVEIRELKDIHAKQAEAQIDEPPVEPNPRRLHELENIFAKLAGILDGSDIDRFRRREEARSDAVLTVAIPEAALRYLASFDKVILQNSPDKAAMETFKALLPHWGNGPAYLIKWAVNEALKLHKEGRLEERVPFRKMAIKVAAQFLDLQENRIERLLRER